MALEKEKLIIKAIEKNFNMKYFNWDKDKFSLMYFIIKHTDSMDSQCKPKAN